MRNILFFISCLFPFFVTSQLHLKWNRLGEVPIQKEAAVAVDFYNNLYISNQSSIDKFDSNLNIQFHQSNKSWGNITSIDARNPMKVLYFSEEQQQIGFLDNTLTEQQIPFDLMEEKFSNVTSVAYSGQPDKIWLFDTDNSQITLLSTQKIQSQVIENLYGLLHLKELHQMMEYNNRLYLLDPTQGIFILNRFGSWIDFIRIPGIENFAIVNNTILFIKDQQLHYYNLTEKEQDRIEIPLSKIHRILINGNRFYLIDEEKIYIYNVEN